MRRHRRRGGGGGSILVMLSPFLIYAIDFAVRMTNGDVLTGGLSTGILSSLEVLVACIFGLMAASLFWFWSRLAGAGFGLLCAIVAYYLIQLIEEMYFCQIGLGCA